MREKGGGDISTGFMSVSDMSRNDSRVAQLPCNNRDSI